jgi:N-carbamoyl-L-amino-acid hydrolase
MITAHAIERRLAGLSSVGVGSSGVMRMAWTPEDDTSRNWFCAHATSIDLRVARDPAGNLWARPSSAPPWWGVGSHLDSVRDGGLFDGPLGVACGFEVAAAVPGQRVVVLSFADEEGARFNTPTFGSKALTGRLDLPAVLERRDDDGVALQDAMRDAGVDPGRIGDAPRWLAKLAGFVEIHIDQTTDVARAGAAIGIVRSLACRRRLQVELRGRADHAGTTPRDERRDALAAAARLIVAADELSVGLGELTVTTSRILAEPNATTTIAARVRLWIDARSVYEGEIEAWQRGLSEFADGLSRSSGVQISLEVASRSAGTAFAKEVRAALARAAEEVIGRPVPEVVCFAGHDAGVLAERVPAAMVLVRNKTGVSHSPAESVDPRDAAVAAEVVARALATLGAS